MKTMTNAETWLWLYQTRLWTVSRIAAKYHAQPDDVVEEMERVAKERRIILRPMDMEREVKDFDVLGKAAGFRGSEFDAAHYQWLAVYQTKSWTIAQIAEKYGAPPDRVFDVITRLAQFIDLTLRPPIPADEPQYRTKPKGSHPLG